MTLGHDTIVSLGARLPPSLGVLGRLQGLLEDADVDLDEIVDVVHIDPSLTFQVIKLANSALFGLRSRCESLDEAVARVGFGDIHQIVGLAVAKHSFQGELAVYDMAGGRLWENAVAVATLNAAFAEVAGAEPRNAYTTGLLRNIGKVLLNNHNPALRYPGEALVPDVQQWEKEQYGYSSSEVSAVLLDHWRFAPEMCGSVCSHRRPDDCPEFHAHAARLHLACCVAVEWGCHLPGEGIGWQRDAAMLEHAGVREDRLEAAVARAREAFIKFSVIEWSDAA